MMFTGIRLYTTNNLNLLGGHFFMHTKSAVKITAWMVVLITLLFFAQPGSTALAQTGQDLFVSLRSTPVSAVSTGARPFVLHDGAAYHMWYGDDSTDTLHYTTSLIPAAFPAGTATVFSGGTPFEQTSVSVLEEGGVFYLITYGASNQEFSVYTSADGINWTFAGDVFDGTGLNTYYPGGYSKLDAPYVMADNGAFKLYFQVKESGSDPEYRIFMAESGATTLAAIADGNADNDFTLGNSGNPVLSLGTSGEWDDMRTMHPMVVKNDGTYFLWYSAYGYSDRKMKFGFATAPDGMTFTKSPGNPVLEKAGAVGEPSVLVRSGIWEMWYLSSGAVEYIAATNPFEFTTIQDAVDAASPGDTVHVGAGIYTIPSTITLDKALEIAGAGIGQTFVRTAGTASDPTVVFSVTADNVHLSGMTIQQQKTTNTSVETAVQLSETNWPNYTALQGFVLDSCRIETMEFGLLLRGSGWQITNNEFAYTGPSGNNHRFIGVYGNAGDSRIENNTLEASSDDPARTVFIYATSSGYNETYDGKIEILNNDHSSGNLKQFYLQDAFAGTGMELDARGNTFDALNADFVLYAADPIAPLDYFTAITLMDNTTSNSNGKGLFALDGTGSPARDPGTSNFTFSGNTLGNPAISHAEYTEASGSSGGLVGYKTAVFVEFDIRQPPTETFADDDWAGLADGTMVSVDGTDHEIGYDAFDTVQSAIDAVTDAGTVYVLTGEYIEDLQIDKALSLLGPNADVNPNTETREPEATIIPATSGPDPFGSCAVTLYITSSDVTVKGLYFNGDNPSIDSGISIGSGDVDACVNMASWEGVGNIVVENNILEYATYDSINFYNYTNTAATSGNYIRYNLIKNIGGLDYGYGAGILVYNNFYADVTDNVLEDVRVGIQTGNYWRANPGDTGTISNNTITTWRLGIFHNLWYSNASTISVDNNTITAASYAEYTDKWNGVLLSSFGGGVNTLVVDNTILVPEAVAANLTGPTAGYNIWNDTTTAELTLSGGTVTGADYGVWVNNYEGYSSDGGDTAILVDGLTIEDAEIGINVWDSPDNTTDTSVSAVVQNTTITNATAAAQVSGDNANGLFKGNTLTDNLTVFLQDGGVLTAYANNITSFTTGMDITAGTTNARHNWWGAHDANPGGVTPDAWDYRLGAEVLSWADGVTSPVTLADSVAGANASLTLESGLGGTMVLVNHGPDTPPFDKRILRPAACSDYYDAFVVGGELTATYSLTIPVSGSCPAPTTMSNPHLLRFSLTDSKPDPTCAECWEPVTGTASSDALTITGQIAQDHLGGTPFVAPYTGTTYNLILTVIYNK